MANKKREPIVDALARRCEQCSLRELCVPAGVPAEELSVLESCVRRTPVLRRGEFLFHAGEPSSAVYIVRNGSFKSVRTLGSGEENIVGFHIRGDLFGLDGLAPGQHAVDVMALENSSACVIAMDDISSILSQLPGFCSRMMMMISDGVGEQYTQQMLTEQHSALERVARFLIRYSERLDRRNLIEDSFALPLSRRELANYLGLQLATVSRMFGQLRDERVLEVEREFVTITDPGGLARAAGVEPDESMGLTES